LIFIGNVGCLSSKEYFLCGYLPEDLLTKTNGNEKIPVFYPSYLKFESTPAINYNLMTNWTDFKNLTNLLEANPYRAVTHQFNEKGDLWLRNYEIKICFHTKSEWQSPDGQEKDSGYAGCSSYMVVENREAKAVPYDILNIFNTSDVQKKCMQIEKIELDLSGLGLPSSSFYPKDINYEIISIINGPVRSSLVVKISFPYESLPLSSKSNNSVTNYKCGFYRCLYLYPGKYYVKEDIFALGEKNELLNFKLDFCTSHMFTTGFRPYRGLHPDTKVEIEDWFAFGDPTVRHNIEKNIPEKAIVAYGFASNCGEKLYECRPTNCRWMLKKTQYVHCLHKPLCTKNTDIDYSRGDYQPLPFFSKNMGDEWYDVICVNLWADLPPGIEIL
jgi:hypothetical protein